MSLDFEWAILPGPVASARANYDECEYVDGEDCVHVPDCFDAYRELIAPYHYQLTYLNMGAVRSWMLQARMVYEAEYEPGPPLPLFKTEEWRQAGRAERIVSP
jgi:hypothetical protein